ncbi:hypothetical protein [Nocardioides jejuensis]|uniref:DUF317 domain-containing protein n=1 Tax=Nocardioides jejuensis TaxID=2502782 RepID=A0A4R1CHH6_9ACTN|nr:hypothetical protein [Nocardioides jejuensis]TCJ30873.1 hypothetical protein EPD65_02220 [Nocardioides jejuensis]
MRPALAVAASAALALSLTACTSDPPATPTHAASANPRIHLDEPATADNRAATAKYADWLLHAVPMPKGSKEWTTSPAKQFRSASVGLTPSDDHFRRTTWWTVPASVADLETWVHRHAPRPLRADNGDSWSSTNGHITEHDLEVLGRSTSVHTGGIATFAISTCAGGVAVRVDTFVAARFARTAWIPRDVSEVTIRRTTTSSSGPGPATKTTRRTVTAAADVQRLVDLVNTQPGVSTVPEIRHCPDIVETRTDALTFHSESGEWVAVLTSDVCFAALTLRHDGTEVGPALEPSSRLFSVVNAALRNASAPATPHS